MQAFIVIGPSHHQTLPSHPTSAHLRTVLSPLKNLQTPLFASPQWTSIFTNV